MEIAEAASFGTRKSQVQILPPRPPSNKIGGSGYYRYEFWVGSWVDGPPAEGEAPPVTADEIEPGIDVAPLFPAWPTHRRSGNSPAKRGIEMLRASRTSTSIGIPPDSLRSGAGTERTGNWVIPPFSKTAETICDLEKSRMQSSLECSSRFQCQPRLRSGYSTFHRSP